ncbi:MAG: hypothetical protein ABSE44_16440, partial [Candidatus Sulfotelmatobacter sp.]
MKSTPWYVILAVSLLALTNTLTLSASAREVVLPAGTLLKCTLDEPNLSSATVDVGDPVLCHLHAQTEFGQQAFPRGSYLVGHLESAKEPGHFWGKGYLKLQFDRIGLPTGDLPLEAKVIATRGYKVDKQGDIKGKGHAVRDVIEWMIPPLWPWKVIMLPARGPRPTLKGETALSLRLMDDVEIPQVAQNYSPSWHFFGRYQSDSFHDSNQRDSNHNDTNPSDSYQHNSNQRDSNQNGRHPSVEMELSVRPSSFVRDSNGSNDLNGSSNYDGGIAQMQPASQSQPQATYASLVTRTPPTQASDIPAGVAPGMPIFVLTTGSVLAVSGYGYTDNRITYSLVGGGTGVISTNDVDWNATTQLNAQRGLRLTLRNSHATAG